MEDLTGRLGNFSNDLKLQAMISNPDSDELRALLEGYISGKQYLIDKQVAINPFFKETNQPFFDAWQNGYETSLKKNPLVTAYELGFNSGFQDCVESTNTANCYDPKNEYLSYKLWQKGYIKGFSNAENQNPNFYRFEEEN